MKKSTKLLFSVIVTVLLSACFAFSSFAAEADIYDSLSFKANASDENTVIMTQEAADGKRYFFLPSSADLSAVTLYFEGTEALTFSAGDASVAVTSGKAFDLTALFAEEADEYTVSVNADGEESALTFMKSASVRALYYVSADPENYGLAWVDAVKGNEAEGNMSLVGTDGEVDYTDKVTEIKGRGNSTFNDYAKKPYQIKIKNKAALIEGSEEKNKKWVLLANAAETTLIHNSITFALADMLSLEYTTTYEPVDLYFDGEYRGAYLLCEKVEIDSTKVDIDDLDGMIEDLNADTDAYENPVVVTKTTASAGETDAAENSAGSYKYVSGLIEPEIEEGNSHHAYLLELEYAFRYPDELTGFVTKKGQAVVTKGPEYLTKETGAYISAFWQEFEDAVYSADGYNTKTGKYYYEYCDLDSLVDLYLINELGKNYDAFCSSTFFYLPADSDIMYAGPVWDYDICYGIGHKNRSISANPENFFVSQKYLVNGLLKIESFRDAVKEALNPETGKFYTAVQSLLGEDGLIASQSATVYAQQKMNFKVWDIYSDEYYIYNNFENNYRTVVKDGAAATYDNAVDFFGYFVETRLNWLSSETQKWSGDSYTIKTDPVPVVEEEKPLSFFEMIIAFFQSIIDWIVSLFS